MEDRLKSLDAHSSVSKEFRVYTVQGAVLSVVTVLAILYLVISEASFNFQVTLQENVHVNATSSRGLEMEFDITFPALPCSKLKIDAADPQGQPQSLHLDKAHHVWKHRIKMSEDGKTKTLIGSKTKLEFGSTLKNEGELISVVEEEGKIREDFGKEEEVDEDKCESCYGAGEEGECCNTCEDVRRAYKRRGWVLRTDITDVLQCKHELGGRGLAGEAEAEDEGCNVHGVVALSTGGGNLHLAPGRDAASGGMSILDALMQSFLQWNVSHVVHKIRFGPEYPAAIYQLDGENRMIEDMSGMYQYYFQVVPTLYKFQNGTSIQTNQYSVTEHLRHINPGSNRGLPGVFFFYEVSPLHVEIVEGYRKGWIAFFTSVCAIVGGVVTVMGMLDQFLFSNKNKRPGELMR